MKLIVDSGSTKADWKLCATNSPVSYETIGFNPYHISEVQILDELKNSKLIGIQNEVKEIIFYGAGCKTEEKNQILIDAFHKFFPNLNNAEIYHDILGACRALFGNENGIACILGTGTNTCVYQNGNITENIAGLGYIIGDEGSGTAMGKLIIQNYLYGQLPNEINEFIEHNFAKSKYEIFDKIYSQPQANRYIASYSRVASAFQNDSKIDDILFSVFSDFIDKNIKCYSTFDSLPIGIVGSIGYIFQDKLNRIASEKGVKISNFLKSPIDKLVAYHL